jgi:predicted MFS family arabinose efflux permease
MFSFGLGIMSVWAFVERVGVGHGFSASAIGKTLSVSLLASLCGALIVGVIRNRMGRLLSILLASGFLFTSSYALVAFHDFLVFAASVTVFAFFWTFAAPYQLSLLALADSSGRTIVISLAMIKIGYAVAPAIGGLISTSGGFESNILLGMACFVISFLCLSAGSAPSKRISVARGHEVDG